MCVVTPEEMQPPEGNFLLNLSKLGCMSSSLFYRFVQILQHAAAILSWVNLFINFIILKKLAFYFCSMTYNNKVYSGLLKELLIFLKKRLWTQYFLDYLILWNWMTLLLFIIRLSFFYFFIIIYCIAKRSVKEIQHCFTVHNCARWISTLLSRAHLRPRHGVRPTVYCNHVHGLWCQKVRLRFVTRLVLKYWFMCVSNYPMTAFKRNLTVFRQLLLARCISYLS